MKINQSIPVVFYVALGISIGSLSALPGPEELEKGTLQPAVELSMLGNVFPLEVGCMWRYKILKAGSPAGILHVEVKGRKVVGDSDGDGNPVLFELEYRDSYTKKNTKKYFLVNWSAIFLRDKDSGKFYPFLNAYLVEGERVGRLLVTEVSLLVYKSGQIPVITVRHMDKDYVERYMQGVGLYHYKNDDLEYKLVEYRVPRNY